MGIEVRDSTQGSKWEVRKQSGYTKIIIDFYSTSFDV